MRVLSLHPSDTNSPSTCRTSAIRVLVVANKGVRGLSGPVGVAYRYARINCIGHYTCPSTTFAPLSRIIDSFGQGVRGFNSLVVGPGAEGRPEDTYVARNDTDCSSEMGLLGT